MPMARLFVPTPCLTAPETGARGRLAALLPLLEGVTPLAPGQARPGPGDLIWTTLDQASLLAHNQIIDLAGVGLARQGFLRRLLLRRCLGRAVHVVAETEVLRQELLARGWLDTGRLSVIPLSDDGALAEAGRAYVALFRRLGPQVALRDGGSALRPRRRAARIGLNPLPAE